MRERERGRKARGSEVKVEVESEEEEDEEEEEKQKQAPFCCPSSESFHLQSHQAILDAYLIRAGKQRAEEHRVLAVPQKSSSEDRPLFFRFGRRE